MREAQSTRGRPPNITYGAQSSSSRIGWLLRVNRLYGSQNGLARGTTFARAFRGGCSPVAVDGAQITRWELAAQQVRHTTVRRYEELLDLPANRLVAVVDVIYREARQQAGSPALSRGADHESYRFRRRTHELLDRVFSSAPMSGHNWDELSSNLSKLPSAFLYPRDAWSRIGERLLTELVRASGLGWLQRNEAIQRLIGHPYAQEQIIAACAALARDRSNQVYIEPTTILQVSPHPDAALHLMRQIIAPVTDQARSGAWLAAGEKLLLGHFSSHQLSVLARHAADLVAGGGQQPVCSQAAAEFLRQSCRLVPVEAARFHAARSRIDTATRNVLTDGWLATPDVMTTTLRRIADSTTSGMEREPVSGDQMLTKLLSEMLFHPQVTRRIAASILIEATPYRCAVAAALLDELKRCQRESDPSRCLPLLDAFSRLADPDGRQHIERLLLTQDIAPSIAEGAIWSLAHMRGTSPDKFWSQAYTKYTSGSPAMRDTAVRGIIYGMGAGNRSHILRRIQESPTSPSYARTAAHWWLNTPSFVTRSINNAND